MSNLIIYKGQLARRVCEQIKTMPYPDMDYLTPQVRAELENLDKDSFDEVLDVAWELYERDKGTHPMTVIHEHRYPVNKSLPVDHYGLMGAAEMLKAIALALVAITISGLLLWGSTESRIEYQNIQRGYYGRQQ